VMESLDALPDMLKAVEPFRAASVELLDRTYLEFVRALGNDMPASTEAVLLVELEAGSIVKARNTPWTKQAVWATDDESAGRLWELRHRASPILAGLPGHLRSLQVLEDGCVPLPRLGEYIRGLRHIAKTAGFEIVIFGHAGDAHVHANLLCDTGAADLAPRLERCLREASALQLALGGTVSGEHGDGRLRAPFLERLFGATYMDACRRVKNAWDPRGLLNPGVKIGDRRPETGDRIITADMLKVGAGAPTLPSGISDLLRDIERDARWDEDRLSLLEAMKASSL
jgi:FAD/FMN-containing dehydrogenase